MPVPEQNPMADIIMQKLFGSMIDEAKSSRMAGLIEGQLVHFVLSGGRSAGQHRPAIIVNVWRNVSGVCPGYANLLVFMDGTNDGMEREQFIRWETSVCFDENASPRTWHWVENT